MKKSVIRSLLIILGFGLLSFDLQARKIECHAGESIRIIETRYPPKESGIACNVTYHKPSEGVPSQALWEARNEAEYCGDKAWFLANKLEDAGWICNSIYETETGNKVIRSSRTSNGQENVEAPTSPLEFRQFLEQQYDVDFQTTADYRYSEDKQDCAETNCKSFYDYRVERSGEPVSFFGYKVSDDVTLWMDLECDGSHCQGRVYRQGEDIEMMELPEFENAAGLNIFLKSKHKGYPDLWLPISRHSPAVVEAKLLRYDGKGYRPIAHLLAEANAAVSQQVDSPTAFEPGMVTLKASFGGEELELVYRTGDVEYEGLLLNPTR